MLQERLDYWIVRNRDAFKALLRVVFGVIWLIDGALKFQPGLVAAFPSMVSDAAAGQPPWLAGWFAFWAGAAQANPALLVYSTGVLETALGVGLLLGLLRKVAYGGGFLLSLFIWAVPEGFGGPYGPGSTDIGTGVVYAIVFLFLVLVNATYGPSRYSMDQLIERRWPAWRRLAEIQGPWARTPQGSPPMAS